MNYFQKKQTILINTIIVFGWDAKYNYEYINNILNVNVNFYPLKSNVKCKMYKCLICDM